MKNNSFEKLNNGIWKKIAIASTCLVAILLVGILATTHAKYKLTESINIVNGTINYKVPDLKVMAMYTSEDGTNYTETTTMPESSYVINEEKTYCTTDNVNQVKGKIKTEKGKHLFSNLNKGDKCYLYFDKKITSNIEELLASLNIKTATPNFANVATTDEGVYAVSDGMYYGTSYYWRGAVTNNYVKFAGFCWRIVRINGDGSIRLIYDGESCHPNGTKTLESIAVSDVVYNSNSKQSNYVGWTYEGTDQRTLSGTASNAKIQLESWYSSNITEANASKVVIGKYCNNREVQSGDTWTINGDNFFYYEEYANRKNGTPTLSCPLKDVYTLNVGLITASETIFAGASETTTVNKSYYLYNGQNYWTMSPAYWGTTGYAGAWLWYVHATGPLSTNRVTGNFGLRPVINLHSNITFSSGDGTVASPYVVK